MIYLSHISSIKKIKISGIYFYLETKKFRLLMTILASVQKNYKVNEVKSLMIVRIFKN